MKSRATTLALSAAVLLALGGCKTIHHITRDNTCNKPQPYMAARSIPPLRIPEGLDAPDTSHALDVPKLDAPPPPPRGPKDPCLSAPPSFNVPQPNARPGE
ncbi:MAG TPA: hypothetical protein VFN79_11790 [Steroidobacteraceae bacterium]|nr:hypothetical protein [Steroidobacteraceae bacterium]